MCRTIKVLISNWPWTRFSELLQVGKRFWLLSPWSEVGQDLPTIFVVWLVKIWQVSWCGKFIQHLETCLLWQSKPTEFYVNLWCFNYLFHWLYKMKYSCYQESLLFMAGLFIELLVEKCVACQSGNPISDGIVFVFHRAGRVRGLKSLKRFRPYLIAFRSCISNSKPE